MKRLVFVAAMWGVVAIGAGQVARGQVNNGFGPDIRPARGAARPAAPWSQTASFLPPVTHAANYTPAGFEPIPAAGPANFNYSSPPPTYVPTPGFAPNTSVPPGSLVVEPLPQACPCPPANGPNCKPLLPICPMPNEVVVGRGILGQPKAYVPNQPVRNFIRYLFP